MSDYHVGNPEFLHRMRKNGQVSSIFNHGVKKVDLLVRHWEIGISTPASQKAIPKNGNTLLPASETVVVGVYPLCQYRPEGTLSEKFKACDEEKLDPKPLMKCYENLYLNQTNS